MLNTIVSIGLILLLIIVIIMLLAGPKKEHEIKDDVNLDYEDLSDRVVDWINNYIGASLLGMGLSQREFVRQEEHRRAIARQVRNCCSGDSGAREATLTLIRQYLVNNVSQRTLIRLFEEQEKAGADKLFSIMLCKYNLDCGDSKGFSKFVENASDCFERGIVTSAEIEKLYDNEHFRLTLDEMVACLSQMIYSEKFGLGCIDLLNYDIGVIEEIQLGFSGPPPRAIRYQDQISGEGDVTEFSTDAVHVVIDGVAVRLAFLSFGSESEVRRVMRNLIKCTSAGELTQANPYKIVDSIDGRRITGIRPPASDAWCALVRKFDSVKYAGLEELYKSSPDGETLIRILRKVVLSGASFVVDGAMGTGKTTALRAMFLEIPKEKSIRTIEDESFEIALRKYLPGRDVASIRITDYLESKDALGLIKKTSGQVLGAGEITTVDVADMFLNLCKISDQAMTTAHYTSTEEMIADFVNARLCHGYTSERLAEIDVVRCINLNIHLTIRGKERIVDYIDEVILKEDVERMVSEGIEGHLDGIRRELGKVRCYDIVPIVRFDWFEGKYIVLNKLSKRFQEGYAVNCATERIVLDDVI